MLLLCALVGSITSGWAAENDKHDFEQSISALLNNGASINSIIIPAQSYTVKEVIISYTHNKSLSGDFVTATCAVGDNNWGSEMLTCNTSTTQSFSGSSTTGEVVISFTNPRTGTKQGTFQVTNVCLVEGSASTTVAQPTFSPESGAVEAGTTVTISSATEDATIYYTMGENPADPTTSSTVYTGPITINEATTIKAIAAKTGMDNSGVASASYTIKEVVHGYTIDFEKPIEAYVDWTITNIGIHTSGVTAAHGGSAWGSNVNESGNGVSTASIQTKEKVANPGKFTCYISKESSNSTSSSWKIQVSSNGTSWTDIATLSSMTQNTWTKFEGDIAAKHYTDVYVRLYYNGSNAKRAVDDIILTEDDGKQDCGLVFAAPSYKVAAGLNNFPIPTLTNPHGVTVVYSSSDEDVALVDENNGFVAIGTKIGTATITATFAGNDSYRAGTATYTITTYDPNANDGSEFKPYTVTEALALINTLGTASSSPVYVKGIVSTELSDINSTNGYANYYISVDGTTTAQLECYRGYNLGKTKFTTTSDLSLGDEVVVYGSLKMFNSTTPEFNQNNFISQLKHGSEPEVRSIEVKAANKYKSYVSSQNLVVPAGVTAYIATGETATELTLTSVPKIKAGTPVILYADASEDTGFSFQITDDEVTYPATNLLKISDGTVVNGAYVLAKKNDVVGFYKWAGGALSPGKVYVEPSSAAREFIGFNFDEVTGINEVKNEKETVNGIFDLQGRKVITPSKGLYIVNGKKVVIK